MIRAPEDKQMSLKGKVWMHGQVSWMYGNEVVEMGKGKEEQGHEERGNCKRSA